MARGGPSDHPARLYCLYAPIHPTPHPTCRRLAAARHPQRVQGLYVPGEAVLEPLQPPPPPHIRPRITPAGYEGRYSGTMLRPPAPLPPPPTRCSFDEMFPSPGWGAPTPATPSHARSQPLNVSHTLPPSLLLLSPCSPVPQVAQPAHPWPMRCPRERCPLSSPFIGWWITGRRESATPWKAQPPPPCPHAPTRTGRTPHQVPRGGNQ